MVRQDDVIQGHVAVCSSCSLHLELQLKRTDQPLRLYHANVTHTRDAMETDLQDASHDSSYLPVRSADADAAVAVTPDASPAHAVGKDLHSLSLLWLHVHGERPYRGTHVLSACRYSDSPLILERNLLGFE